MKNIFRTLIILSASVFFLNSCGSTKQETDKPAPQVKPAASKTDAEYERATKDLKGEVVSKDTYEKDKKFILSMINELNAVMKSKNYKAWLNYVEPNSVNYWSQKKNLSAASKQLPVKGIQLKSLEDYFNYVFIPSRMGKNIDEIRYVSSKSIKAVQLKNEDTVIYYNFKKIGDDWLVELPSL